MPGTPTTRLSIPTISGSADDVSTYPAVNLAQVDILDNAAIYLSGTLVARPAATAVAEGTFYRATDTGLLYESNGTVWQTVMLAGAWVSLTLPGGVSVAGGASGTPEVRAEGDIFRLSGAIENTSGSTIALGNTVATCPVGFRSAFTRTTTVCLGATSVVATIGSNGVTSLSAALPSGSYVFFDGATFAA